MPLPLLEFGYGVGGRLGEPHRPPVEARDLHFLIAVVRAGSMMKAATDLGVSQPVVSEAIADLESKVGVRLLDRGPRGVEPTLYGKTLLSRSQIAFDQIRQAIRDIEFLADPTTGEVRIGCPETLAAGVLSPIIDELSRRSPRVRFQVALVSYHHRLEFPELLERKLDLILERDHEASGELNTRRISMSKSCSTNIYWWLPA